MLGALSQAVLWGVLAGGDVAKYVLCAIHGLHNIVHESPDIGEVLLAVLRISVQHPLVAIPLQ